MLRVASVDRDERSASRSSTRCSASRSIPTVYERLAEAAMIVPIDADGRLAVLRTAHPRRGVLRPARQRPPAAPRPGRRPPRDRRGRDGDRRVARHRAAAGDEERAIPMLVEAAEKARRSALRPRSRKSSGVSRGRSSSSRSRAERLVVAHLALRQRHDRLEVEVDTIGLDRALGQTSRSLRSVPGLGEVSLLGAAVGRLGLVSDRRARPVLSLSAFGMRVGALAGAEKRKRDGSASRSRWRFPASAHAPP